MLYLNERFKKAWISPIVFCYLAGILIGNLSLDIDTQFSTDFSGVSVSLAIPILLFSSNLLQWLKHSKKTFLSFFLAVVAVLIASSIAYFLFRSNIEDCWKAAGMMVGVYTGGTPNMQAIGLGLGTNPEVRVLLNSADVVVGSLYFLFLITFAGKFFSWLLPSYKPVEGNSNKEEKLNEETSTNFSIKNLRPVLTGIAVSVLILGAGAGISLLVPDSMQSAVIILCITTLGFGASFIKSIHKLPYTEQTAEYLLLIFAVSIGTLANFAELAQQSPDIFYFVGFVFLGSIVIHLVFAVIVRIDRDTFLITSTAGIYGPPFVGPVADALGNREIIVPGFAMGTLGYLIGNYLGMGIAIFLSNFG